MCIQLGNPLRLVAVEVVRVTSYGPIHLGDKPLGGVTALGWEDEMLEEGLVFCLFVLFLHISQNEERSWKNLIWSVVTIRNCLIKSLKEENLG